MSLESLKAELSRYVTAIVAEAQAARDREWAEALSEKETPLFAGERVLPFVPESPQDVPELLRLLDARLNPSRRKESSSNESNPRSNRPRRAVRGQGKPPRSSGA